MTAALSLLSALCLACIGVAGSGVWGGMRQCNGWCYRGEAVGGVGHATEDAIAGHGIGGVEGQGTDKAVIDRSVWGVRGHAV
jgi:hypothetical protein